MILTGILSGVPITVRSIAMAGEWVAIIPAGEWVSMIHGIPILVLDMDSDLALDGAVFIPALDGAADTMEAMNMATMEIITQAFRTIRVDVDNPMQSGTT